MRLADCKFSFVKHYKIFFSLTIIFLIVGIASMFVRGFNLGIDYTGGSLLDLQFAKPVSVTQVREVLKKHDLGNAIIQLESADAQVQEAKGVLIRTQIISDENRKLVMADFTKDLGEYQINRVENVGATVGGELIQQAILAIVISWILMIIYITVRFQFKFALAAIIALIIDVLVTVSYFSLLHLEIDSTFVAALLTVVGYSINGTIVIFDRIRENLKLHRRSESLTDMIDRCIWATMTRTLYTNGTSIFAVVAIFLVGGDTIHNFSFAMLVGFCSGCYTSIFLSGPLWLFLSGHKAGE
jgi:preprotein translocase subunit SecF